MNLMQLIRTHILLIGDGFALGREHLVVTLQAILLANDELLVARQLLLEHSHLLLNSLHILGASIIYELSLFHLFIIYY